MSAEPRNLLLYYLLSKDKGPSRYGRIGVSKTAMNADLNFLSIPSRLVMQDDRKNALTDYTNNPLFHKLDDVLGELVREGSVVIEEAPQKVWDGNMLTKVGRSHTRYIITSRGIDALFTAGAIEKSPELAAYREALAAHERDNPLPDPSMRRDPNEPLTLSANELETALGQVLGTGSPKLRKLMEQLRQQSDTNKGKSA